MSTEGRMTSLKKRHEELDVLIAIEMRKPAPDNLGITRLKREKLQIKEEMVSLEESQAA